MSYQNTFFYEYSRFCLRSEKVINRFKLGCRRGGLISPRGTNRKTGHCERSSRKCGARLLARNLLYCLTVPSTSNSKYLQYQANSLVPTPSRGRSSMVGCTWYDRIESILNCSIGKIYSTVRRYYHPIRTSPPVCRVHRSSSMNPVAGTRTCDVARKVRPKTRVNQALTGIHVSRVRAPCHQPTTASRGSYWKYGHATRHSHRLQHHRDTGQQTLECLRDSYLLLVRWLRRRASDAAHATPWHGMAWIQVLPHPPTNAATGRAMLTRGSAVGGLAVSNGCRSSAGGFRWIVTLTPG